MIGGFLRRRRREQLRTTPFPAAWARVMDDAVPWVRHLPADQRRRLEWLVMIFLAEVHLEGCGGHDLDEAGRVIVATAACRLLLGRAEDAYEGLQVVRVHPTTFLVPVRRQEGLLVHEGVSARLGESWRHGVVILAWDAVRRGLRDEDDGHDVVVHEFAHQLDTADGRADGAPVLPDADAYRAWAGALGASYAELQADLARGHRTVMDAYGATEPAEFFAVASEVFFERPRALARAEPRLYAALSRFYGQDPAGVGGGPKAPARAG